MLKVALLLPSTFLTDRQLVLAIPELFSYGTVARTKPDIEKPLASDVTEDHRTMIIIAAQYHIASMVNRNRIARIYTTRNGIYHGWLDESATITQGCGRCETVVGDFVQVALPLQMGEESLHIIAH